MDWVEKNFAEGRVYDTNPKGDPVRTEHLTYAMFQHDTSRKLDPQAHIHVVIANLTKVDGDWRALHNEALWKNNSIIGSVYHAELRALVEKLGYETRLTGKHGQFEIEGVPQDVLAAFSRRREEILAKSAEIGIVTPQGRDAVVVRTRDAKVNLEDRDALRAEWRERAEGLGFDGQAAVAAAELRANAASMSPLGFDALRQFAAQVAEWFRRVGEWLRPRDPLLTQGIERLTMDLPQTAAEVAVASAIRILGQREAAFPMDEVKRTALDLGIKGVTITDVERRMAELVEDGLVLYGASWRRDGSFGYVTTPEHVAEERSLLAGIDAGRGAGAVVLKPARAAARLQEQTADRPLGAEQLAAGILALSSADRIVVIQGVAGAGKTSLIAAVAQVAQREGKQILGLAQANTMVAMLMDEAGIPAKTVSSFVHAHLSAALAGEGETFDASRATLKNTILVLDEASLVANKPMNDLVTIANRFGVDRLVMIGDRAQLQPIDAGKAFTLIQSHEPAMARMEVSHRQRTEHMKAVAALTRAGEFSSAFEVLGDRVVGLKDTDFREAAAKKWLELSAEEREQTTLYASGREIRSFLNTYVQQGLKAEGVLRGDGVAITTIVSVNLTREELRYAENYRQGQLVEVIAKGKPAGLAMGEYEMVKAMPSGIVKLRDQAGQQVLFWPSKLDPAETRDLVVLSQREPIHLYEGDRIRWTVNDKNRGLLNSAKAEVLSIGNSGVEVRTADGKTLLLEHGDRMLSRLALDYALNMHRAQGMTTDRGIGVMHSGERNLSNQRLAHVMATRVRDDLTIFTNSRDKLLATIDANPGNKASAIEHLGEAAASGLAQGSGMAASPQVSKGDPFDIDPASMRAEKSPSGKSRSAERDLPEIDLELGL
jgi:Mrp family chromosome partitioning ATPase